MTLAFQEGFVISGEVGESALSDDPEERILAYKNLIERGNFFACWATPSLDEEFMRRVSATISVE